MANVPKTLWTFFAFKITFITFESENKETQVPQQEYSHHDAPPLSGNPDPGHAHWCLGVLRKVLGHEPKTFPM